MKLIINIFLVLLITNIYAQDIHYSQFTSAPLIINPALTAYTDCNLRAGLNYRNQWNSISSPYVTQSVYVDGKVIPESFKRDWFGLGGMIYNDKAGDGSLSNTKGMISATYNKGLNEDNTLFASFGASFGVVNRSVDFNKLSFDNQWNGTGFDPSLSNNENYSDNSIFYADFNAGMLISYTKSSNLESYLGISLSHINRPKDSFYDNDNRLGRKTIIHGGLFSRFSEKLVFNPQFMYSVQQKSSEIVLGGNFRYDYSAAVIYVGMWYRWGRDFIPTAGLEYRKFLLMISYDINSSDLNQASNYNGGLEISITKKLFCSNKRPPTCLNKDYKKKVMKIKCPTFE